MAMKGMPRGARKPSAAEEKSEGEAPHDLLSALDSAPDEVAEGEADGMELDAEQQDLVEQMGLDPEEGKSLKRFVESCCR